MEMNRPKARIKRRRKRINKEAVMRCPHAKVSCLLFCLSLVFLFAASVCAQDMQALKSRMLERKPTIDALKNQGIVGEGIDGYLHFRQQSPGDAGVVNAENQDRRTVNGMIASREGTSIEQVSRKAAQKIIANARPGHWVQRGDGSWYRK
jgi:uncharacterized protein YdbL (DUF1318 family)